MSEPAWKQIAAAKQAERESKIPPEWKITVPDTDGSLMNLPRECGIFTEEELAITETLDSVELLSKIHSGQLTSLAVTQAFCKRAAVAQQATNCLTEIFFEEAYTRARSLDTFFQRTCKPTGPLHGLPIALKDSINVAGIDSSICLTGLAFQPKKENSVIVDILLKLGAVMYVKTNVPQSMMVPDTQNWMFGQTRNPRSGVVTAAGSSGGLGALVAFRGSLMGIGTDVGGSVRMPAYCNGVYGVKPSSGRLPYHLLKGYLEDGAETVGILCVNGVIASSMRDCELLLRSVSQAEPWLYDPGCAYLPWTEPTKAERPLVFGVIREDHETSLLPPVSRVLSETCKKLEDAGHEIFELEFHRSAEISANAVNFFKIDGGKALKKILDSTGEPYTDAVKNGGLYPCEAQGLSEFNQYSATRAELQHSWLKYWASTAKKTKLGRPIDAILTPLQSSLPRPNDTIVRSHYTRTFNVLDYPGAVIQCGVVDLEKDSGPLPPSKGELDDTIQSTYSSPEKRQRYANFPVGLQLVCQRQMEQRLMEIALVVDEIVHR